jgi:hypothetical protein
MPDLTPAQTATERGDYAAALALALCALLIALAREGAGLVRWLLARVHPPPPAESPSAKIRAIDGRLAPTAAALAALAARVERVEAALTQETRSLSDVLAAVERVEAQLRGKGDAIRATRKP